MAPWLYRSHETEQFDDIVLHPIAEESAGVPYYYYYYYHWHALMPMAEFHFGLLNLLKLSISKLKSLFLQRYISQYGSGMADLLSGTRQDSMTIEHLRSYLPLLLNTGEVVDITQFQ